MAGPGLATDKTRRDPIGGAVLMGVTVAVVASASLFMIQAKGGVWGMSAAGAFILAAIIAHFMRRTPAN